MGKMSEETVEIRELRRALTECQKIIVDLQAHNKKLEEQLTKMPDELRGLYITAALKFGTMVAPLTSEMLLPLRDPKELVQYNLNVSRHEGRGEILVRVKHKGAL